MYGQHTAQRAPTCGAGIPTQLGGLCDAGSRLLAGSPGISHAILCHMNVFPAAHDVQTYVLKLARSGEDGDKVLLLVESGVRFHTVQASTCHPAPAAPAAAGTRCL